ncbi:hypothetical protein [Pontibacter roseus]|uniref:hypothetical protein n=1 Tax=Pontibacter roseus TaxID=336989 RepID=UPI00037A0399|nr:hypothetical protein [Pontibacter roseus]
MVEINIEKKKKPVWPWILLLIILALIGWAVYEMLSSPAADSVDTTTNTTGMVEPAKPQPPQHTLAFV